MDIIKRNGSTEPYERAKIARVIERAFASVESTIAAEKLNACYVLATQYFNDETYNNDQMTKAQTIPSIKGYEDKIDDANMKVVADIFFNASNVQLWYDQYLPASVTEVHKNCMTELFGLDKTPQEIGEEQDAAMQAALAE